MNEFRPLGHWQGQDVDLNEPDLESDELPDPRNLVCRDWIDLGKKQKLVAYLRSGATYNWYRGFSYCRFDCGIDDLEMGSRDFTDGVWVWPEGLHHYVDKHDVMLPDDFVSHCEAQHWKVTASMGRSIEELQSRGNTAFDHASWIGWARETEKSLGNQHRSRLSWVKEIRAVFPDWGTEQALQHWLEVRQQLCVGQPVEGSVVARADFGLWLDIGVNHPALLLSSEVRNSRVNFKDHHVVGDVVEAWISFVGYCPPVRLTQQPQS
jgi:hypothetical protein